MPTQNLMAASSSLPQVLVAQQLSVTETTQYTGPANSSVKIASATLTNTSNIDVRVSLSVSKVITPASVTGGDLLTSGSTVNLFTTGPYFTRPDHIVTGAGTLTSVALNISTGGTVGISIGTIVGSVYAERVNIAAVSKGTGTQTLTPNVTVYPGEVVGIFGTAFFHIGPKVGSNTDSALFSTGAVSTAVPNEEWGFQITVNVTGAGFANRVMSEYLLKAGDSTLVPELDGVLLGPTDFISAIASATSSVAFVATGIVSS